MFNFIINCLGLALCVGLGYIFLQIILVVFVLICGLIIETAKAIVRLFTKKDEE